jgi:hypothetical protein
MMRMMASAAASAAASMPVASMLVALTLVLASVTHLLLVVRLKASAPMAVASALTMAASVVALVALLPTTRLRRGRCSRSGAAHDFGRSRPSLPLPKSAFAARFA